VAASLHIWPCGVGHGKTVQWSGNAKKHCFVDVKMTVRLLAKDG
jgi:hypothetical protein